MLIINHNIIKHSADNDHIQAVILQQSLLSVWACCCQMTFDQLSNPRLELLFTIVSWRTRETRTHLILPEETQAGNQTITFTFQTKLNQTGPNVLSESSYRREESNYNLPTLHTLTVSLTNTSTQRGSEPQWSSWSCDWLTVCFQLHLETQWLPG